VAGRQRLLVSSINNPEVKQLVAKMVVAGLSAKSVNNYVQVVKMVVASAINENGEELYPRKWNHEFLDLPEVKNQKQPACIRLRDSRQFFQGFPSEPQGDLRQCRLFTF
jgi:hypothetical protein